MNAVYEKVKAYHETHGDDVASDTSRHARYRAIRSLLPAKAGKSILDVGCGTRQLRGFVPRLNYTGIDLLEGTNVLDVDAHYDYVVANGCLYKLPSEHEAHRLLEHCWGLADEAFVFTSLNSYRHFHAEELCLDPFETARWADKRAPGGIHLDLGYKPGDFAILMLR